MCILHANKLFFTDMGWLRCPEWGDLHQPAEANEGQILGRDPKEKPKGLGVRQILILLKNPYTDSIGCR